MYNLLSLFTGALICIMISLNGMLTTGTGNYSALILIHFIGILGVILILILTKSKLCFKKTTPWFLYTAGCIGVFTVLFNNLSFLNLGMAITLSLGLLGQAVTSLIIDNYGLMGMKKIPIEKKKFVGLSLILIGIVIMTFY